ncbi:dsDNA nuclease domain-containing protein [Microbispora catharanthi]|uniref:DUF4297 domain-containing protein n=1 Tax=Microbispora catharanthi TaxID=1712871 RepID=A0A5N6BBA1_9ACTN|nr:dsDNA nuclease domain-containing protein [Microbispora catharanthi]KAB8178337.1 DUF4297 domain-containing protein [Microbispora catharanthi]
MTASPADGGRRSRRGFAYQDAVTLLDCLDMLEGSWTEVSWEDLEDILCRRDSVPVYRQVKTLEGAGTRHSVAIVCSPEKVGKPESSYLGKLFVGKPLPDSTRFTLILNEVPLADLHQFSVPRGGTRGQVDEGVLTAIVKRLEGLTVPDGRDVAWCVERLEVLVEARTVEQVEQSAIARLEPIVQKFLGQPALYKEIEDVLIGLVTFISRDALNPTPTQITAEDFRLKIENIIQKVTGRRADGTLEPLTTLQEKLHAAEVSAAEAERQHESMLAYRRRYRSSIGKTRAALDDLADEIFAICSLVMAQRRAGLIPPGSESYARTILQVSQLPRVLSGETTLANAYAILSDITARCQNRYADAS